MSLACDYFKNMYQYINFSCLLYSLNYQPLHKQLFKEEAKFSKSCSLISVGFFGKLVLTCSCKDDSIICERVFIHRFPITVP